MYTSIRVHNDTKQIFIHSTYSLTVLTHFNVIGIYNKAFHLIWFIQFNKFMRGTASDEYLRDKSAFKFSALAA